MLINREIGCAQTSASSAPFPEQVSIGDDEQEHMRCVNRGCGFGSAKSLCFHGESLLAGTKILPWPKDPDNELHTWVKINYC